MACSSPNVGGYSALDGFKFLGPRYIERDVQDILYEDSTDLPCGKCELCRIDQRYSKALRIMLEAQEWPQSTFFFTLTFDDAHLGSGDLDHSEWSQFMKDFRQEYCQAQYCDISVPRHYKNFGKVRSKTFKSIKQVMCGEYGDQFGRKHFHGIIFNHSFSDLEFTGQYSNKGFPIFTSASLRRVWKKGIVQVSEVTFDLALYVGSYVTDALDGQDVNAGHLKKQYGRFGNGIGLSWLKNWWRDVLTAGQVKLIDGVYPVPRYFHLWIEKNYPVEFKRYRDARKLRMAEKRSKFILKGDGPLRRAKAKGRIQQHNSDKRRKDATSSG